MSFATLADIWISLDNAQASIDTSVNIQITSGDEPIAQRIEAQLLTDLRQHLPQTENKQFVFAATSNTDVLLGGVTASTAYGWLLIKTLWVHEEHRRSGLGSSLMQQAESAGRNAGCHAAWLDTSNPCAKQFYTRQGYTVFGELQNNALQAPASHTRWFMKKSLEIIEL